MTEKNSCCPTFFVGSFFLCFFRWIRLYYFIIINYQKKKHARPFPNTGLEPVTSAVFSYEMKSRNDSHLHQFGWMIVSRQFVKCGIVRMYDGVVARVGHVCLCAYRAGGEEEICRRSSLSVLCIAPPHIFIFQYLRPSPFPGGGVSCVLRSLVFLVFSSLRCFVTSFLHFFLTRLPYDEVFAVHTYLRHILETHVLETPKTWPTPRRSPCAVFALSWRSRPRTIVRDASTLALWIVSFLCTRTRVPRV